MASYLTYIEIAEKLGVSVDTVRRNVLKMKTELGISPCKQKTPSSKGALVNCLTVDDANIFINYLESRSDNADLELNEGLFFRCYGYFYIIQLIPEFSSERVKIGFADDVNKRLIEHQCSSPTAKILGIWPCKRAWDQAAMDSITREDCTLVMNEVYEGDIEKFLKRANDFFEKMPKPENKINISEYSPLNKVL